MSVKKMKLYIPQYWKEVKIIMLHKKGDKSDIQATKSTLSCVQNLHKDSSKQAKERT